MSGNLSTGTVGAGGGNTCLQRCREENQCFRTGGCRSTQHRCGPRPHGAGPE